MKIAIYSRKSKFTGKGESIENQIQLCKEYAEKHFGVKDFIIYEDEGFSGGNIDRPQYQKMLKDAQAKKFDVLICYRLDRISRNVLDFSHTVEILNKHDISFVSIREHFDTSTPMGRAMMYISSVFAQLERETLAERVKDNMQKLALTGRWLGGKKPYGFTVEQVERIDLEGKKRKAYKLAPKPKELEIVKLIYKKYLELESFTKVESYLIQNNIKRNGNFFNQSTISYILRNPVYCKAEPIVYEYFNKLGAATPDIKEFNSKNGLIGYAKRDEKKWIIRDKEDWFIGVGVHEGIISGEDWVRVQNIIEKNSSKAVKNGTSTISIITPLLKCSCGQTMKVSSAQKDKDGNIKYYYYVCRNKERTKGSLCNSKNLNGFETDEKVIKSLKKIASDKTLIKDSLMSDYKNIDKNKIVREDAKENIIKEINKKKNAIDKLVETLAGNESTAAAKYIMDKINKIDEEIKELNKELTQIENKNEIDLLQKLNIEIMLELLDRVKNIENLDFEEQQQIIHRLVDRIEYDGENVHIHIKGIDFTNCST